MLLKKKKIYWSRRFYGTSFCDGGKGRFIPRELENMALESN